MAYSTKVGSFAQPGSTGNQSVTGLGFTPKAIIFTITDDTSDQGSTNCQLGVGWASSSTKRGVCVMERSTASASANSRHDDTKCIALCDIGTAGAALVAADFVTMDADGFTVNWTTVDATARIVNYWALGGSDLTNATVMTITSGTSTGNKAYTGAGFQGDALMLMGIGHTVAPPSSLSSYGYLDMGWALSSSARAECAFASATGLAEKKQITTKCYMDTDAAGGIYIEADFVSFDADGFTLNWSTVQASEIYLIALVLKGGQYAVGAFDQPTANGTQAISTAFTPTGLMLMGYNAIAGTTIVTTNARKSLGFTDGSSQSASWIGASTTNAGTGMNRSIVFANNTEVGPASQSYAAISSFGATDFTLNWTLTDATARQSLYFAVGSTAAAAVTWGWIPEMESRRWPNRIVGI